MFVSLNGFVMKNRPLLSICIPTYNRKAKLARTLDRLIPQCLGGDIEIVVSDNASNDGTSEYCLDQSTTHKFFSYFCQKKNVGFSDNLISVLSRANGEYLWMLGDDEVVHSEAVIRILNAIVATHSSWLVCNFVKLKSPSDKWPVDGEINFDKGLQPLTLDEVLNVVGIWASFMSISIIRRDTYWEWAKYKKNIVSDYVGFEIALFSGYRGKCYILSSPILARIKEPLNNHRFDKLPVYIFDFFDPIDSMVKQGVLSSKIRTSLAHEMFFSMAGFLLLKTKIRGGALPKIGDCIRYHATVPMFWLIIFPLLISPSWFVKCGIGLLAYYVPKNSNTKLSRLITSLNIK